MTRSSSGRNEQGVSCEHVTTTYIQAYYEDMEKLGVRRATLEPRATEHIADIVTLVDTLLAKGMAYRVDGDVYFQVDRVSGLRHDFPSGSSMICRRAHGWMWMSENVTRWILPCGKAASPVSLPGIARGARAVPAGISNVRPWPCGIWAKPSIFMAAGWI